MLTNKRSEKAARAMVSEMKELSAVHPNNGKIEVSYLLRHLKTSR